MAASAKNRTRGNGMNILNVADYGSAYEGNFIRSMRAVATAVKQSGGSFVWVLPSRARDREWAGHLAEQDGQVFFLCGNLLADARMLRGLTKRFDIDIIHTHFADKSIYIPLRLAAVGSHAAHIAHVHSELKGGDRGFRGVIKKLLRGEAMNICVGEALTQQMESAGYKSCVTVDNAVDFSRLDSFELPSKTELNIPDGKGLVFTFGYDFAVKGVDTALTAMSELGGANRYILLICPAAKTEHAKRTLCEKFGEIPDFVRLLPPRDDIASYYRLADVFLAASRTEGFSYAVVEAAYCGVPIALSDIPAHRQRAIPGSVFFNSENPRELLEAVDEAYGSKASQTVDEAAEYVRDSYSIERWTERIVELYADTINMRTHSNG